MTLTQIEVMFVHDHCVVCNESTTDRDTISFGHVMACTKEWFHHIKLPTVDKGGRRMVGATAHVECMSAYFDALVAKAHAGKIILEDDDGDDR